jgi:serine protease Do
MTKQKKSARTSRYACSLRYALLAVELWCISMLASMSLLTPQQVYAQSHDSIPGGNVSDPTVRAVDIAKPAVVRIWTDVPGHLTVHFPPTTDVSFPQKSNDNYPLAFTDTGTFISSQGDVLTADHVVQPSKKEVLDPALYSVAAQDVANYMNQNAQAGSTPVSTNDVMQQLTSGQIPSSTAYDPPTIRVYLSTDYVGTFKASDLKSVPSNLMATVDTIKAQSSPDQQDLAIVHVPMTDTPSVALGNSDNVQQQDQLTVIGFPGNADVSQKPQDFLASSISSVYVSSKKTSNSGAPLLQIGGNIDRGDNGAPALNRQGEVVGIVSFGLSTASNNSTIFLQTSGSARDLAQSINLDTNPGSFQKQWSQAFADYAATTPGHWHKAAQEFTQLAQSYPQFQAVQPLLTYARTQAETESTSTVSATPTQVHNTPPVAHTSVLAPWQAWAIIIGSVVLLLVLAVSLFAVTRRKRERKTMSTPKVAGSKNASAIAVPKASESPTMKSQPPVSEGRGQNTLSLKVWPCGHMNRANARFCSVCGEAAPDK